MTAHIAPLNPELIQQNRRKDMRIAELERENAQQAALLRQMHAEKLANYKSRMRRNRIADEYLGYVLIGALAVGLMWLTVLGAEWLVWKAVGLC